MFNLFSYLYDYLQNIIFYVYMVYETLINGFLSPSLMDRDLIIDIYHLIFRVTGRDEASSFK